MRPTVLVFVRHYLPGYKSGGPIRTIANLIDHLGDEFNFRLFTSDRDATDTEAYPGVAVDRWNDVGKAKVYYASPASRSLGKIAAFIRHTPHDILYLNSFFDPHFSISPLVAGWLRLCARRPTVLAPRGEFAASALAIKARKKTLFLSAAKGVGLHATVLWQASSAQEEQDILRMRAGIGRGIGVAINLPPAAGQLEDFNPPRRDPSKPLSVCFLSRITPMKNLDFALRVLGQVRAPVIFSIYGPIRDEPYWAECRTLVESLPPTVQVLYQGTVEHDRVGAVLEAHDLFFLPTRGENYGHVILEALSAGLPVLIADTTPWHGLADAGAGWDLPLTDEGAFAAKIDEVAALDPETHGAMRRHAAALAGKHLDAAGPIRSNRDLFLAACQSGRQSGNSA